MDQPKIERMLRLMKLLSSTREYSIDELAIRLEMSPRTIYRYIDTFKNAGFAVSKIRSNIYRLETIGDDFPEFEHLIYFSEEESYIVNSLIDRLDPSNSLKAGLKAKLSTIYDKTGIADFVDKKSTGSKVEALGEAIRSRKRVVLRGYESGNSHTVRDRVVEPFGFTRNFVDVWAFDVEDGKNKIFKIFRVGSVEICEEDWMYEQSHKKSETDAFRMSGDKPVRVRLQLSLLAKNLLVEEFPLAERDLRFRDGNWILDTNVYSFAGVGRFFLGVLGEAVIIDSPEFGEYVESKLRDYLSSSVSWLQ